MNKREISTDKKKIFGFFGIIILQLCIMRIRIFLDQSTEAFIIRIQLINIIQEAQRKKRIRIVKRNF